MAGGLLLISAAIDVLMVHFGSHPTVFIDLIMLLLAALIVFRPQWIDKWNAKNLEGIENSDPDLRKWF